MMIALGFLAAARCIDNIDFYTLHFICHQLYILFFFLVLMLRYYFLLCYYLYLQCKSLQRAGQGRCKSSQVGNKDGCFHITINRNSSLLRVLVSKRKDLIHFHYKRSCRRGSCRSFTSFSLFHPHEQCSTCSLWYIIHIVSTLRHEGY